VVFVRVPGGGLPWAFTEAKDSQLFIAALELLRSLLCIVLFSKAHVSAEVSEQMRSKNLVMGLPWVSCDDNGPADELSNSDFYQFDLGLRILVGPKDLQWRVLPELMAAGTELSQEIAGKRTEAKAFHKWTHRDSANLKHKHGAEMAW
jgi:hypothetical protein